jgi:hypothetical protein
MDPLVWFQRLALDVRMAGAWRTIHLFDNAHGAHDEHSFRGALKLPALEFFVGSNSEAIPRAISLLKERWPIIMEQWRTTA